MNLRDGSAELELGTVLLSAFRRNKRGLFRQAQHKFRPSLFDFRLLPSHLSNIQALADIAFGLASVPLHPADGCYVISFLRFCILGGSLGR